MGSRPYGILIALCLTEPKMKRFFRKLKDQDAGAFDFLCNYGLEHQYIDNSNPGKFIDKKCFYINIRFFFNFDSISN